LYICVKNKKYDKGSPAESGTFFYPEYENEKTGEKVSAANLGERG
jgi:hypothetical protein